MKEEFLQISDHDELAAFFDLTYRQLAGIIYDMPSTMRYTQFEVPKRSGGTRLIQSPCRRLKAVQRKLHQALSEVYEPKQGTQGFVSGRSIVTNAEKHLDKRFIFNVDLADFFGSIHFGRVRNLFRSEPFNFNPNVATILAQVCCFDGRLPQGAPTSPVLSNIICWKLDAQMQELAKRGRATYSRYADDITFSFSCSRKRLPSEIVLDAEGIAVPGPGLRRIVEANGFELNYEKVRLAGRTARMEATGLVVNEFTNVPRRFIRQTSSMIYAWRTHGYAAAAAEFNEHYATGHRPSGDPRLFERVVRGRLAHIRQVRGKRDPLFNKLAEQYNDLVGEEGHLLRLFRPSLPEEQAAASLWVLETCYDDEGGEAVVHQGTGFMLAGVGLVTCAHVVSADGEPFCEVQAYRHTNPAVAFPVTVRHIDVNRDAAICEIESGGEATHECVTLSNKRIRIGLDVRLLGFPAFAPGASHFVADTKVASTFVQNGVQKLEVGTLIRKGNSGGPVVDTAGGVVGIAIEGATGVYGRNAVLRRDELLHVVSDFRRSRLAESPLTSIEDVGGEGLERDTFLPLDSETTSGEIA